MSPAAPDDRAPSYSRTQVGWWTIVALGGSFLLFLVVAVSSGRLHSLLSGDSRVVIGVVPGIMLLVVVFFSTLNIRVTGDSLRWRFGPGLLHFSVPLDQVVSVSPARTSLLSGLGIHWIGSGWVYNVSGRDAVEITRRAGGKIWLGTPEPAVLAAAIERARASVGSPSAASS